MINLFSQKLLSSSIGFLSFVKEISFIWKTTDSDLISTWWYDIQICFWMNEGSQKFLIMFVAFELDVALWNKNLKLSFLSGGHSSTCLCHFFSFNKFFHLQLGILSSLFSRVNFMWNYMPDLSNVLICFITSNPFYFIRRKNT